MNEVNKNIGSQVRRYRKAKKLKQSQLAMHLEIDRTSVANIEAGRHNASLDLIVKICDVFSCTPNDLFQVDAKTEKQVIKNACTCGRSNLWELEKHSPVKVRQICNLTNQTK
jgi:DNA-binding XRE family transcriptional regulator